MCFFFGYGRCWKACLCGREAISSCFHLGAVVCGGREVKGDRRAGRRMLLTVTRVFVDEEGLQYKRHAGYQFI
jgi:hypothetical protein